MLSWQSKVIYKYINNDAVFINKQCSLSGIGYIYIYIYIYIWKWMNKVKLATVVEGDQKAPFS